MQRSDPRRRELDRERDAVEATDDLGDGLPLGVGEDRVRVGGQRPFGEQSGPGGRRAVDLERRHLDAVLAVEIERLA